MFYLMPEKKKKLWIIFILILLFIPFFSKETYAHRPYAVKDGILIDPHGNMLVKEKLYGDGVFVADPVTFQIRNRNGAVLAKTPVAEHAAVFCPHIKFCWVFPYGSLSLFSSAYKLDVTRIEWDVDFLGYPEMKKEELKLFQQYLMNKDQNIFRSYSFDYPEFTRKDYGFVKISFIAVLSPIAILIDQFFVFLCLFVLTLIIFLLFFLFFRKKWTERKLPKRIILVCGGLAILGYLKAYSFALFVMGYTLLTPLFYMLGVIFAGTVLGVIVLRKIKAPV